MIVDALILAGGRSSRLGPSGEKKAQADKQKLQIDGVTLLERSIHAVQQAGVRSVIVVGDETVEGAVTVREEPAFAGPVTAIAAGLAALPGTADAVLVIACDMPGIGSALPPLLDAFRGDGAIAVDRGRRQQLAVLLDPARLATALAALPTVADASMRSLLDGLVVTEAVVPDGATDDIDTRDDADRFGAVPLTGAHS